MSAVRDAVIGCIRKTFPAFEGEFTDDLSAKQVPGWDSFSHVNLMFEIEEALGRDIDVAKTFALPSIGALIAFLDRDPGDGPP